MEKEALKLVVNEQETTKLVLLDHQEVMKSVLKEALKEWLDEKFATLGRWSASTLGALILVALIYFMLKMNGWTHV